MLMQYVREIHIDARVLPPFAEVELVKLGFFEDGFVCGGNGMECPAFHYTWQASGENRVVYRRFERIWRRAARVVQSARSFVGYLEAEVIPPGFCRSFPRRDFQSQMEFPVAKLSLVRPERSKVSDLHIKIPLKSLRASLVDAMCEAGFYFVETPKGNRIYTLQFTSHREGRLLFETMLGYFAEAGGAVEITYEICPRFLRIPERLDVPLCVEAGSRVLK